MKLAILAVGSRGDVQPYVALGAGLVARGHEVRFVTSRDFEALARAHGLDVRTIDVQIEAALQRRDTSRSIEGGGLVASFRQLASLAKKAATETLRVGLEAAQGAEAVLAGFGGILTASSLAEKLGIPFIQAYNVPLTPTTAFPGALLPWLSFWPRGLTHRLSHWLTQQALWQVARSSGDQARREVLGLAPAPLLGPFASPLLQRAPLLYGFSEAVIPRPDDWGEGIEISGYWFLDEPPGWTPPSELVDFLQAGPAPVYLGFGSMSSEKPEETLALLLDAVAASGQRAVIHRGWTGWGSRVLPKSVLAIESVPHSWLLPRMSAIVHHGGAGTTAAAMRAGVPALVVPFHGDQPFWAQRTERLGVGPRSIPRTKLTPKRLAEAIQSACGSEAFQRRAADIGEQVRTEEGVQVAVRHIERFLCVP